MRVDGPQVRVEWSGVCQIAESAWMGELHARAKGPFVRAKTARVRQIAESVWIGRPLSGIPRANPYTFGFLAHASRGNLHLRA